MPPPLAPPLPPPLPSLAPPSTSLSSGSLMESSMFLVLLWSQVSHKSLTEKCWQRYFFNICFRFVLGCNVTRVHATHSLAGLVKVALFLFLIAIITTGTFFYIFIGSIAFLSCSPSPYIATPVSFFFIPIFYAFHILYFDVFKATFPFVDISYNYRSGYLFFFFLLFTSCCSSHPFPPNILNWFLGIQGN